MADRIAIMRDGRLVAFGPSQALYRRAAEPLRGGVSGPRQPAAGDVEAADRWHGLVARSARRLRLLARATPRLRDGDRCLLCIRPHACAHRRLAAVQHDLAGRSCGRAVAGRPAQHRARDADGAPLRLVCTPMREPPRAGAPLELHFSRRGRDADSRTTRPSGVLPLTRRSAATRTGAPECDGPWIAPPLLVLAARSSIRSR